MSCKVMGIVNVTPDSFSDGGAYFRPEEAIRRAVNLIEEGADIIDLGGESTRPGATPIDWSTEWERISPVLEGLCQRKRGKREGVLISVDTYHPETAERAVKAGANMINCVAEDAVKDMIRIVRSAEADIELVIPATYQLRPEDSDLKLYLDPMIGFGTTREEDLARLKSLPILAKRGRVLVGVSRKRIIKKLTGEKVTGKNLGGSLAMAIWCAQNGASALRVHDVRESVQALRVMEAMA